MAERRKIWRFSLRTILVLMTGLAIWLGIWTDRAARERAGERVVEKLGGSVMYTYQFDRNGKSIGKPVSLWPDWLREWLGKEYFDGVKQVDLGGSRISERDMALVCDLPHLEWLRLRNTRISNGVLQAVGHARHLTVLDLTGASVTDKGISHLAGLTSLRQLYLGETDITDEAVATLAALPSLRRIDLYGTKITEAGIAPLVADGKYVLHLVDVRITALDADEKPITEIQCGSSFTVRASYRVPRGATRPAQFALVQVWVRRPDIERLFVQSGSMQARLEGDMCYFEGVFKVPKSLRQRRQGGIALNVNGAIIGDLPVTIVP